MTSDPDEDDEEVRIRFDDALAAFCMGLNELWIDQTWLEVCLSSSEPL